MNHKCLLTIFQTSLHFNVEVATFVHIWMDILWSWNAEWVNTLERSNLMPRPTFRAPQHPAEQGCDEFSRRKTQGMGGGWNWGTDFARLSHMAKHAQRGQLSLNKHNHFLLAAHKAFKQKPVRRSSQGHLGERTASHQNTAGSLWLSICRHPKKTQTWPCSSTSPHTPKIPLQQTRLPYKEYIWPFACRQKLRQVSVTERKALASTKLLSFTILNKGCYTSVPHQLSTDNNVFVTL